MRMTVKLILIGMLLASAVTDATAELQNFRPYGGVDYMFLSLVAYNEGNLGAVRGKLGAELNPYLALEGHVGTGVVSDDDVDDVTENLALRELWGFYVRGILPLHERVKLYGLFGITRTQFEIEVDFGTPDTEHYSTSGYSYGLGVEAFPLENLSLVAEFVSLIDELEITGTREEGPEITAITLGVKYYF